MPGCLCLTGGVVCQESPAKLQPHPITIRLYDFITLIIARRFLPRLTGLIEIILQEFPPKIRVRHRQHTRCRPCRDFRREKTSLPAAQLIARMQTHHRSTASCPILPNVSGRMVVIIVSIICLVKGCKKSVAVTMLRRREISVFRVSRLSCLQRGKTNESSPVWADMVCSVAPTATQLTKTGF